MTITNHIPNDVYILTIIIRIIALNVASDVYVTIIFIRKNASSWYHIGRWFRKPTEKTLRSLLCKESVKSYFQQILLFKPLVL